MGGTMMYASFVSVGMALFSVSIVPVHASDDQGWMLMKGASKTCLNPKCQIEVLRSAKGAGGNKTLKDGFRFVKLDERATLWLGGCCPRCIDAVIEQYRKCKDLQFVERPPLWTICKRNGCPIQVLNGDNSLIGLAIYVNGNSFHQGGLCAAHANCRVAVLDAAPG